MHSTTTLVINWHITEECNYRCKFCYAKWDSAPSARDLIREPGPTKALLEELYRFFLPGNLANPLWGQMNWETVRLNLAGGEPLLYRQRLPQVVRLAREIGFEVSLITNGSYLTEEVLADLAPHLTWLGISLDSTDATTNKNIGRIDRQGRVLDLEALALTLRKARALYPLLRLKLNTVVNSLNSQEDFGPLVEQMAPEKWKALRVLPIVTDDLTISNEAFGGFVGGHTSFKELLCAEDNHEMRESYLMVDPNGSFFQNGRDLGSRGHVHSRPILEVGADIAFSDVPFDSARFCARYPEPKNGFGK